MAVKIPKQQYDPNSVVDTFKSLGMDSSYDARKAKATELGIKNYSGTEQQNIKLRNLVAGNGTSAVALGDYGVVAGNETPKAKPKAPKTETPDTVIPKSEGLDAEVPASATMGSTAGVSKEVWDAMNTPFTASSAYAEAMDYTNRLREQLSSGRTSYTEQIEKLMAQIQGRDKFSYDVSQDTLFQQSLASAMASGKTAMQDTIGQASALTGGYGSTYATSAGNQAYNGYIQDAYANLPEYYQMALEAYQMEGQEMYDQLAMLSTADATEYGRMYDAWNVNNSHAMNLYAQEYGAWQDTVNNAYNMGNLQLNEQGMLFDQDSTLWSQTFQQNQADKDNEYRDKALEQDDDHYYAGLEQDQSQFNSRYDVNGDGVVDSKDQTTKSNAPVDENGEELATLSNSEINEIKKIYTEAGGGEAGLDAVDRYLTAIGKNNVDNENLMGMLNGIKIEVPVWEQDWVVSNDTFNWFAGDDDNDEFSNGEVTMTYGDLEEALEESDLSEAEKKKFLKGLKGQTKKYF